MYLCTLTASHSVTTKNNLETSKFFKKGPVSFVCRYHSNAMTDIFRYARVQMLFGATVWRKFQNACSITDMLIILKRHKSPF